MGNGFQIHLVTDRQRTRGDADDLSRVVAEALLGGVDCVQVREKGGPALALYETALGLLPHAREAGVWFLINDRVDVALASGADGVHLAAKSLPPAAARDLLGEEPLLGCSVHALPEAREAANAGADYVTFGHVYPTSSKPGLPPRGVRELAAIVESVDIPVLAVGGIDEHNLQEVLKTGASGIAVISTIAASQDPRLATQRLRRKADESPHHPRRVLPKKIESCESRKTRSHDSRPHDQRERNYMNLTVNQEPARTQARQPTVWSLLEEKNLPRESVVVALNGEVLRKEEWDRVLSEGDEVEIVRAVAGGEDGLAPGDDDLVIAGERLSSRLILGTGKYPDTETMNLALERSGTDMVTVAIRYMNDPDEGSILDNLDLSRYRLLPNTAGATRVDQAVKMAHLAREATGTNWIKLEIIGDQPTLWPDTAATIEATEVLVSEGFVVLPYTSPDLVAAMRLEEAGAATIMPLGSPIGSGQGMPDWAGVTRIIERISSVPVVVDAGLGVPSDVSLAMELGADAVLVNTAVARADDPPVMAEAMKLGARAGRLSYLAGRMPPSPAAHPSSPTKGVPA